jgi:hypothetical protein
MTTLTLPKITLGNLKVARLIAGSNAISGFSHSGRQRTQQIVEYFTVERIKEHLRECECLGIDALVARVDPFIMRVLGEYWREGGKIRWIAQTAPEHRDPEKNMKMAKNAGASAIYLHGGQTDRYFAAGEGEKVDRSVRFIRSLGLPAGIAAHNPNNLLKIQKLESPADFYLVCMYNISGYMGRRDIEPDEQFKHEDRQSALAVLQQLEKPCIAYKILGAGRLPMDKALEDVGPSLRRKDGVLIGMFPPDKPGIVKENVGLIAALRND